MYNNTQRPQQQFRQGTAPLGYDRPDTLQTRSVSPNGTTRTTTPKIRPFTGWVLLPLRLFLGITFVYAGIQKLTDPQFFHPATPGYIGNQIIGFAHGSPLHDLLLHYALPHAIFFGQLVAFGEIAIGLGTLLGALFRPAAFFGMLLSLIFFLSASWRVYPYFYGADIVFVFCWLTMLLNGPTGTGLPSFDAWLLQTLFVRQPGRLGTLVRALLIGRLGTTEMNPAPPARNPQFNPPGTPQLARQSQRRMNEAQQEQERRRNFLLGALTGGASVLGIALLGYGLRIFSHGADDTTQGGGVTPVATTAPTGTAQATTTAGSTATGTTIAQVSAVAKNNFVTFTIPSTGDPGILIHLPNDQFVAYDAVCTHAGCQVDYNQKTHHLLCPCHGAEYDPANAAAVLGGPTNEPLAAVPIHIDSATGAITLQ